MGKGREYQDRRFRYEDPYSGREILRLTDYLGHSCHFYFTDPCWFNDDRSLLFHSDREGQANLFRYDLDEERIVQLTDLQRRGTPRGCVSAANNACYYWWGDQVFELDLASLAERVVGELPPGMSHGTRASPSADGRYLCSMVQEPLARAKASVSYAYADFRATWFTRPHSQILRIEVATGAVEVIHEDHYWIGHVNTSPSNAFTASTCSRARPGSCARRTTAATSPSATSTGSRTVSA